MDNLCKGKWKSEEGLGAEVKQEEVRPLCATWSGGNRIHQSQTLSCHFLQSSRRQRGALLNLTDLLDWLQKHHTSLTLGKKKTHPFG